MCDCHNQFTWLYVFPLNWPFGSYFNVITTWFDTIYPTGFVSRSLYLTLTLTWFLTLWSYLPPTVTTSHFGCRLLSEICIYNAKCLCYFQPYATGFSGCMPYLLTWAGQCTYKWLVPCLLTQVYSISCPFSLGFTNTKFSCPFHMGSDIPFLFPLCNMFTL